MGDQYDIFFSYAHADKEAVKPLLAAFADIGLRVFHDETDITDGQSITRRVTEGLTGARMLVAYYSKTYPTRRACQWELTAAIIAAQGDTSDTQAIERRILPLNPEPGVTHIHPVQIRDQSLIPTNGVDPEELANRVAARLTGLTQTFDQLHRLTRPNWYGSNMRLGSNRFVGRVHDLWAIHSGLSQHNFAMITGSNTGLVQVQGMGGIGKTLLAEEYTLRFSAAYPGGIFWLSAVQGESWSTQIFRIASHLELPTANLNPDQVEGLLRGTLSNRGRYLWIVDDLPTNARRDMLLQWSAPSANGVTLVTTRGMRIDGSGFVHRLDVLSFEEAFELLTNRCIPKSESEHAAAREILALLGNHALAVDVARAAVEKLGYVDFLYRMRDPSKDATDFAAKLVGELPTGHEPQIAATLLDSINRLDKDGLLFLDLAALLAPAPIPEDLVAVIFSVMSGDVEAAVDQAILGIKSATSEALSECTIGSDNCLCSVLVHVLVSRTVRFHKGEAPILLREAALKALIERLEIGKDIRNHSELLHLIPHARAMTQKIENETAATLLHWLGRFNHERGAFDEAEVDEQRTLEAERLFFGSHHPNTLSAMNNLATTLCARGDFGNARSILKEVLIIRRQILPENHPNTLISMNNMATVLLNLGDYKEARKLQEEIVKIGQQVWGYEHPNTLTSMSNLAMILERQGDHFGSMSLKERVHLIAYKALGATHPVTLANMNNLAEAKRFQGDYADAREIQNEFIAAYQTMSTAEHPSTLTGMNNLALTLASEGNYEAAQLIEEDVLLNRKRLLGLSHPLTIISMMNLAETMRIQRNYFGALSLNKEALSISRQFLGNEHPDTLSIMSNLAVTLCNQGDYAAARALHEKVLEARHRVLDPEHPDLLTSMNNLASALGAEGDHIAARALEERSLAIWQRVLGVHHHHTLTCMYNLAVTLFYIGETDRARVLVAEATIIATKKYGPTSDFSQTLIKFANLLELPLTADAQP